MIAIWKSFASSEVFEELLLVWCKLLAVLFLVDLLFHRQFNQIVQLVHIHVFLKTQLREDSPFRKFSPSHRFPKRHRVCVLLDERMSEDGLF